MWLRIIPAFTLMGAVFGFGAALAWTPQPVADDPLVRMPGSQPSQGINLEAPNRCLNCHAGFNPAGEPGFLWIGSMMAQSARDPMFWAGLTVAAQDAIWALGTPNAADLCERCHLPEGWLAGRSDPTNASAMTASDFDGVHCDFCHRMWDPFHQEVYAGTREGDDWIGYWDEAGNTGPGSGTLSQTESDQTLVQDEALAAGIQTFSGAPFFENARPASPDYTESAAGQFYMDGNSAKRASFADAAARHQMLYSRYHKSRYFCATCHDVSNPALANLGADPTLPLPTETDSAYGYFHVERTFSEFMLSAYGQPGGAPTNPEFRAQGASDIALAAKCQDCHMRDVTGRAANKRNAVLRPTESTEHPNSGLPLHDLTGGNAWVSHILASLDPNGPVYDPLNLQLLDRGPAVLTLDLDAGQSPKQNGAALKAGSDRAKQQLLLAATLRNVTYDAGSGNLQFQILNNSGHKLPTGYPEGRRMFVNIKAFGSSGSLVHEINPYDDAAGTLKGMPASPVLGANEAFVGELVYEVHSKSSLTGEDHSFHFVLADGSSKDNRIPPKGFDKLGAAARFAEPVDAATGLPDPGFFSDAEYAGGYDEQQISIAPGAAYVSITLYYQGTSREYIEFLRDEINGSGATLSSPTPSGEAEAYVVQTDPFFSQLKAWGTTIWDLWYHNHGLDGSGLAVPGIVPFAMATATVGSPPAPACDTPAAPADLVANAGKRRIDLTWNAVAPAPSGGYRVFYDLAGKAQFLGATVTTSYTDSGLKPDTEFCYAVRAWNDCDADGAFADTVDRESDSSTVSCATPTRR